METRGLLPVQLYSEQVAPKCPYCELPDMERADMMICKAPMPCDMMDELASNGWLRIGDILFKMKLAEICCPTHTARIPVAEFNSQQKKVLKKWKRFLIHGDPNWDDSKSKAVYQEACSSGMNSDSECSSLQFENLLSTSEKVDGNTVQCMNKIAIPMPAIKVLNETLEERDEKMLHGTKKKAFYNYFDEYEVKSLSSSPKHRLEMKLVKCNPEDPIISETIEEQFQIYQVYMKEVFPGKETYSSISEFRSGFVKSPLVSTHAEEDRPMGTYHLQFYIDGKLEGFVIVDILTTSIIPIQFYCNPKLRFLKPHHYSILWLIAFAQRLQKKYQEMRYYYIGPYNVFSTKSSYKATFKPLEVLCPITNTYIPVEKANLHLEKARYARLADGSVESVPGKEEMDVDGLICCYHPHFGPTAFCDIPMEALKKYLKPRLQCCMHGIGANVMNRMLIIIDDTQGLEIKKHTC